MSGGRARELAGMLEGSEALRRDFAASGQAVVRWEHERRRVGGEGLAALLSWTERLREVFGDPPADQRPWRGDDFRL